MRFVDSKNKILPDLSFKVLSPPDHGIFRKSKSNVNLCFSLEGLFSMESMMNLWKNVLAHVSFRVFIY